MRVRSSRPKAVAAIAVVLAAALSLSACSAEDVAPVELPPQASGALPEPTALQVQDAVAAAMAAAGASGAIVGVWAPWSGSWVAGVGTQEPGGAAVSTDMLFPAATLTRPMTCDVLYAVAAEGRVELDARVSEFVPGVADLNEVTLEQLCDGTSGIGAYAPQLTRLFVSNPTREWDPRELASYGLGQERETAPGMAYRESDAGYVLLGLALERVTGDSAAELIEKYVVEPLGLTATSLPSAPVDGILPGYYVPAAQPGTVDCTTLTKIDELSPSTGYTAAGVVTNVHDLGRYVQALATQALAPEGVDRFENAVPVAPNAPSYFTAGGGALIIGGLVGHHGPVPGYSTAAYSDPESGMTIVVALNTSAAGGGQATRLAWQLAAIVSKAPATSGFTAPEAGLPWTAEQYQELIATTAICAPPAA
jgi:D-alanyl-D-alanine carboxypeptidase